MVVARYVTGRTCTELRSNAIAIILAICVVVSPFQLACAGQIDHAPDRPMLVGYLPCYKGQSFDSYAGRLDLTKMTHLNLAFGNPPKCDGVCTAQSSMDFSIKGQTDADVDSVVTKAHAVGVKVLLSIGGGGGDQMILQFYNAGLSVALIASLDKYMTTHHLDGVDVDIEDPSNMGAPFDVFVNALVGRFRPKGWLVTAAVAKYLQDSMPDSALHLFDFINVMNYSSYSSAAAQLQYYAEEKHVSKDKIVLGVPFFATNSGDSKEEDYAVILTAYPNAWRAEMVGGGNLDDGQSFHYVGEDTMARETLLGKQYGGIMIWELLADAPEPHSLMKVIEKNL
jgi:chitinase